MWYIAVREREPGEFHASTKIKDNESVWQMLQTKHDSSVYTVYVGSDAAFPL
jgi:hypothetical protein